MFALRAARVLVAALATAAVTLAQLSLPTTSFWMGLRGVLYLSVVILAFVAGNDVWATVLQHTQLSRVRQFDQDIRVLLSATISQVAERTKAEWYAIGVSAYQVRGMPGARRLRRIERLHLGTGPTMPYQYRLNAGVPGEAYTSQEFVAIDWQEFYEKAVVEGFHRWKARNVADTFRLSWGELATTCNHKSMAACPVFSGGGTLVGVVAVDAPTDLTTKETQGILRDLAVSIGRLGPPPKAWWAFVATKASAV